MVVGHEHHIKQLLTLWINIPQLCIHRLQSLRATTKDTIKTNNQKQDCTNARAAGFVSPPPPHQQNSDLNEGEGRPWAERLGFVLHLMLDVLLHTLLFIDVLLLLHVEEDPR